MNIQSGGIWIRKGHVPQRARNDSCPSCEDDDDRLSSDVRIGNEEYHIDRDCTSGVLLYNLTDPCTVLFMEIGSIEIFDSRLGRGTRLSSFLELLKKDVFGGGGIKTP